MCQYSQDGIKYHIQSGTDVLGEKSQNEIAILLQHRVLPPIAPLCIQACQMLSILK